MFYGNKKIKNIIISFSVILATGGNALAESNASMSLALAARVSAAAFDCAAKKGIKISVAVVNSEGNLVLFQRGDGSYPGSIQSAIDKAKSSNAFRRPTSAFTEAVKTRPELLSVGEIVAVQGGVPILSGVNHLGAIGISGGRAVEDDECAVKAVEPLKN